MAVADAVALQVQQLQKTLPAGVRLEPFYDQSELVRESVKSVRDAILIGLVLACIILFLFLADWTSSVVAGLVIPVTVAITILFLWAIGESFNLMTLGGLAYLFVRWNVGKLSWVWFVVLSLAGGLLFSIPAFLLMGARKTGTIGANSSTSLE